jgi:hypothetical protein
MKKMVKLIVIVIAALILFAAGFLALNWSDAKAFPGIISSFYSKMMCSCLFVSGRSEDACHNFARQYIPVQKVEVDYKAKRVTVKGLWVTTSTKHVAERYGCTVE